MQNYRRNLGLAVILIGLILIGIIVYYGFIRKAPVTVDTPAGNPASGAQLPTSVNGTTTPSDRPQAHATYDISKEAQHQVNATDLSKIAMAFSERFGSFSSQSEYSNFTDLRLSMTDSLKDWVDGYVAKIRKEKSGASYYGIVTTALTASVKSFDDKAGQAEILVTTNRRESTDKINGGEAFRQDLDLKFKKVGGEWLVDEVYWQE